MTTTNPVDAARVELLLADLRLPAIKLMWAKLAPAIRQGRLARSSLPGGACRARDRRSRSPPHRASPCRGTIARGQNARQLRLRGGANGQQGAGQRRSPGDSWLEKGANLLLFGRPAEAKAIWR